MYRKYRFVGEFSSKFYGRDFPDFLGDWEPKIANIVLYYVAIMKRHF